MITSSISSVNVSTPVSYTHLSCPYLQLRLLPFCFLLFPDCLTCFPVWKHYNTSYTKIRISSIVFVAFFLFLYFIYTALFSSEEAFQTHFLIFCKSSLVKGFSDLLHHVIIKIQIVKNAETHSQHFLGFQKMTDIGSAVMAAGRTLASLFYRS